MFFYHTKINFCLLLKLVLLPICFQHYRIAAQKDTTVNLAFDFNEHQIKEKDDKVLPKGPGVTLVDDRFGNEKSAIYLRGDAACYLNLGTSKLLKSPNMSISLWVNLYRRNYSGKGADFNPLIQLKNGPGEDFINAFVLFYNPLLNYVGLSSTKDSTLESYVYDSEPFTFKNWHHVVAVCNNSFLAIYVDGSLRQQTPKAFETKFYVYDSLLIGHSGSKKNERMAIGCVDDIKIFHRPLYDNEVLELYHAPNPNKFKNILDELIKYGLIVLGFVIIIVIILLRNKRALKRQKAQLELTNKISELELKVVKAQMNPHFISNCLAAIQDLIYIAKFSFYLRQVLNYSDENYISIAEELEMIKLYVDLEQLRFKNEFTFELLIDESFDTREILTPSLITQPFIENAIWHGLLPLKNLRPAQLTIRVNMTNNLPVFVIEDNGVGRDLKNVNVNKGKGTKLILDKIESLNRLSKTKNYKLEVEDLRDMNKNSIGTKITIQLENIKE
jgi:hypothetical protein